MRLENARKPTSRSSPNKRLVRVGRIVGTFGIKGEVKVDPLTDFPEDRFSPGARFQAKSRWLTVESVRFHKDRPLVKFEEIATPEAAKELHLAYLESHELDRPGLEADEYLFEDLVGLTAIDHDGRVLGEVEDVLSYPSQEILVVGDILIPMVSQFIDKVDLEQQRIHVRLLPGMAESEPVD